MTNALLVHNQYDYFAYSICLMANLRLRLRLHLRLCLRLRLRFQLKNLFILLIGFILYLDK
jgi:hypothetical protein